MDSGPDETLQIPNAGGGVPGAATPPPSSPGAPNSPGVHSADTLRSPQPGQSVAPTSFSLSGTTGLPPISRPVIDLSQDKLLLSAPRGLVDGKPTPSLGGIPLLSKLGQGGMGAVYYGIHPRLKLEVAVKVLPFHLAGQQPGLVERFFREAQIAAKVQSPHLVNVKDVNEDCGLFYLVMEYVHGTSAGSYLKQVKDMGRPGLPEAEALEIATAATQGLKAAHDESVVHRDIKPDNIMIPKSKNGEQIFFKSAKLADLGLARGEDGAQQSLTGTQVALGTPGYMSPEQADDARNAGKPADVFSMGAAIYAMLTGAAPFKGESLMQIFFATAQKPHEPVRNLRPEISAATAELLDRCLAKDPAQRLPDATALLAALQDCAARLGSGQQGAQFAPTLIGAATPALAGTASTAGTALGTSAVVREPTAAIPLSTAQAAPAPAKSRRWPKVLAAVAVVLLALAVLANLKEKEKREKFQNDLNAAVAKAESVKKASGEPLAQAIADLERFKPENPGHPEEDFKPVEDALDNLHDRLEVLTKRRDDFGALVHDARQFMELDPKAALSKLDEAAKIGAPSPNDGYPDLLSDQKPSLDELKELARKTEAAQIRQQTEQNAARAKAEFETGYQAARDATGRNDWPTAEKTLDKALKTLGDLDHPAKDAAQGLLASVRAEIKKRDDFNKFILEGNGFLKQGQFPDARASFEKAKQLWPQSPELQRASDGIAKALQGVRHVSYETAMAEATEALKTKNWDKAETAYGRALLEKPRDDAALRGITDAQNGARDERYQTAYSSAQRLLGDKKYDAAALAFKSALNEKRTPEAEKGLKDAQDALSDQRYASDMEEATKANADRKWPDAERAVRRALFEHPGDPRATRALNLIMGYSRMDARDWMGAENYFNKLLLVNANDKQAKDGMDYAERGRQAAYDDALKRARKKLLLASTAADYQAVIADANEALTLFPGDKDATQIKLKATSELDRITWPTIKVTSEAPMMSIRTAKVDGRPVTASTASAIEPGQHTVDVEVDVALSKNDFSHSVKVKMERGHTYEIRLVTFRRGLGAAAHAFRVYEDGKRIDAE
ncbi:MAG: protein kinase [Planctomycetes bacterium]|nr:protein kinase [Planctomycetota bacterium]